MSMKLGGYAFKDYLLNGIHKFNIRFERFIVLGCNYVRKKAAVVQLESQRLFLMLIQF